MDELRNLLSGYSLEPWNRLTAGLVAAMFVARLLDFLSTWIVTPKLELEANPLMGQVGFIRMALTIPTKSFQEQGVTGREAEGYGTRDYGAFDSPGKGREPGGTSIRSETITEGRSGHLLPWISLPKP